MKKIETDASQREVESLVNQLRIRLPQAARVRPILMARLRSSAQGAVLSPLCRVTGVFQAGPELKTFCQIEFGGGRRHQLLIAPIEHLSFSRKEPVTWEITAEITRRSTRLSLLRALRPIKHRAGSRVAQPESAMCK